MYLDLIFLFLAIACTMHTVLVILNLAGKMARQENYSYPFWVNGLLVSLFWTLFYYYKI